MEVHYLDNSATTPVLPEAAQAAVELMTEEYGNPSSLHTKGFAARRRVEAARAAVAARLGARPEELTFTSGGTEANNLALFGAAQARKRMGRKIVTTAAEHDSVLNPCRELEKQGFQVVYLKPDGTGRLPEEALFDAIDGDTILVSVMLVNNETGAVFPVEAAARAIRRKKAPALLHTDCVQAFGKLDFTPQGHRGPVREKGDPPAAPCVRRRPGAGPAPRHGEHAPHGRLWAGGGAAAQGRGGPARGPGPERPAA